MPPPPTERDDEAASGPDSGDDGEVRSPRPGPPPRPGLDLAVELARLRAEVAADLSHLGGVLRAEIARLRADVRADTEHALAGRLAAIGSRLERAWRLVVAAQLVALVVLIAVVRSS